MNPHEISSAAFERLDRASALAQLWSIMSTLSKRKAIPVVVFEHLWAARPDDDLFAVFGDAHALAAAHASLLGKASLAMQTAAKVLSIHPEADRRMDELIASLPSSGSSRPLRRK